MAKVKFNDIVFDSNEEVNFFCWLLNAKDLGIISEFEYHTKSFVLFNKESYISRDNKKRSLLRKRVYTPDFKITFSDDFKNDLEYEFKLLNDSKILWVDVKGTFQKNGKAKFSADQKWTYQKYGIYVQKIVPEKLFLKTWVPDRALYTPKRGNIVGKYENSKSFNFFLNNF